MRVTKTNSGLKVHAIAGTYVVLLGFDLAEANCHGLLGFSLHRTDHMEHEAFFLSAMKAFAETDPGFPAGSLYATRDHPIQSFQWADYAAKPGHQYTYTTQYAHRSGDGRRARDCVSRSLLSPFAGREVGRVRPSTLYHRG